MKTTIVAIICFVVTGCSVNTQFKIGHHYVIQQNVASPALEIIVKNITVDGNCILVNVVTPRTNDDKWLCNVDPYNYNTIIDLDKVN